MLSLRVHTERRRAYVEDTHCERPGQRRCRTACTGGHSEQRMRNRVYRIVGRECGLPRLTHRKSSLSPEQTSCVRLHEQRFSGDVVVAARQREQVSKRVWRFRTKLKRRRPNAARCPSLNGRLMQIYAIPALEQFHKQPSHMGPNGNQLSFPNSSQTFNKA